MREWTIREEGYEEEKAAALGNRYLTGNGYLGIRGTLEEYEADRLPAINLAGIYDRSTGWREPVNLPNGCFSYLRVDGEMYRLPEVRPISHGISLDYRHGIFHRHTTWHTARGNVTLRTERFAGMDQVHDRDAVSDQCGFSCRYRTGHGNRYKGVGSERTASGENFHAGTTG